MKDELEIKLPLDKRFVAYARTEPKREVVVAPGYLTDYQWTVHPTNSLMVENPLFWAAIIQTCHALFKAVPEPTQVSRVEYRFKYHILSNN